MKTVQGLVQQAAFTLSDQLFTYSDGILVLDDLIPEWSAQGVTNIYASQPRIWSLQIRLGAGAGPLGYMFSTDFDSKRRHFPQSVIGPSSSLGYLRPCLDQLLLHYADASPTVLHIAAVDYAGGVAGDLVTDYCSAVTVAEDLGLGMVCSTCPEESQHMALLSTLMSKLLPTIHIYDGQTAVTSGLDGALNCAQLCKAYKTISKNISLFRQKGEVSEGQLDSLMREFNAQLGTAYDLFEYHGQDDAHHVLVVFGTAESSLSVQAAKKLATAGLRVGVLIVRFCRPFSTTKLLEKLPSSVRKITVLGQVHNQAIADDRSVHSILYNDVLVAVNFSSRWPVPPWVVDLKYPRDYAWTEAGIEAELRKIGKRPVESRRSVQEQPSSPASGEDEGQPDSITDSATDVAEHQPMPIEETDEEPAQLRTWHSVAKALAFKEAYSTKTALRPDLAAKTWTVRVKEIRRLTPITYERNIFHIEFDLGDSGLKYDIGEALGIHGVNDETEVAEFMTSYGLRPDDVVETPSRLDPSVYETRTVYQTLMQSIDLFGRPPKKFYEALAEFATDEKEKLELTTLASAAGATEFKRRAEVETITYADILMEFPSARPSFHDLARLVSPMKRREYSIASSQKVTPNSVALLVVTVGWVDPRGRDRFGQATRFLAKLRIGDAITVSVKPSVMKLPPTSTQPLIMAGLGTGLAPFRAFVQHRAWQKSQGLEIGSVLLYMGSRHQREEYLYGEEWEAYQDAGIITLLGRAFSRDQPQKIYIQDRMRQSMPDIIQAFIKDTGCFYLCGPTWPVPDVTEVLQEAITLDAVAQGRKVDARKEIERVKDDLRYVLEVY
ncbi:MAG: hypothetical protein M1826_002564 [Phylliscum demangeonii]|nr:MAG: hypothetical protein M1826_002564 [Phylliscum demangeonii]